MFFFGFMIIGLCSVGLLVPYLECAPYIAVVDPIWELTAIFSNMIFLMKNFGWLSSSLLTVGFSSVCLFTDFFL